MGLQRTISDKTHSALVSMLRAIPKKMVNYNGNSPMEWSKVMTLVMISSLTTSSWINPKLPTDPTKIKIQGYDFQAIIAMNP